MMATYQYKVTWKSGEKIEFTTRFTFVSVENREVKRMLDAFKAILQDRDYRELEILRIEETGTV